MDDPLLVLHNVHLVLLRFLSPLDAMRLFGSSARFAYGEARLSAMEHATWRIAAGRERDEISSHISSHIRHARLAAETDGSVRNVPSLSNLTHIEFPDRISQFPTNLASLANLRALSACIHVFTPLEPLAPLALEELRLAVFGQYMTPDGIPFANLRRLTVTGTLKHLDWLRKAGNLESLVLHGEFLSITPLAMGLFPALTCLKLEFSGKSAPCDLEPLCALVTLRKLHFQARWVTSFDFLATLVHLNELHFGTSWKRASNSMRTFLEGQAKVVDLSPLVNCVQLEKLSLCYLTELTDIGPLSCLTKLACLNFSGCTSLNKEVGATLQLLTALCELDLTGTRVRNFGFLHHLPRFRLLKKD
ncbi:hypothetical protein HDU98_007482 [Podochytrium sp. JEL0797]|nr:hypothetical protein HDU98_007482 [Podochytrium sp. JEL0797]